MTPDPVLDINPGNPTFYQDPYSAYRKMRELGRRFFWPHYGIWCFPHFDEVNGILRDRRFGRQNPLPFDSPPHLEPFYALERHSLLELEPPDHSRIRRLVNRAFVGRSVARARPWIEALANRLIDSIEPGCDLIEHYAEPIPLLTITELLGMPAEMAKQMLLWSHDMVAMYQHRNDLGIERQAATAAADFAYFMRAHIAEKRQNPRTDLLSQLIEARDQGDQLSEAELVTTAILLMNAGHEATVHAIGNGIFRLLEAGIDPLPHLDEGADPVQLVDELLRFDPPLHLFTRYALDDLNHAGLALKKGDSVGLLLASANRDPAIFPDPDRLVFDRASPMIMSFGAGIHFCVGAPLARAEIEIALRVLFRRLRGIALLEPPVFSDRYHFHGLEKLKISYRDLPNG